MLGIIFKIISKKDGGSDISIDFVSTLKLTPFPGLKKFAKIKEIVIAKNVVVKYRKIDLKPILPRVNII